MPATDLLASDSYQRYYSSSATDGFAITPDDTNELQYVTNGLYVGLGGDLNVQMAKGTTVILRNVPTGAVLPLRVRKVLAANTTASYLVGLIYR